MRLLLIIVSTAVIPAAFAAIAAHYVQPPRRVYIYITKPITTALILAVALLPGNFLHEPYAAAIGAGLIFSLIGDVLLMLPGERFAQGLGAFMLAHMCYIYAFIADTPGGGFPWVLVVFFAIGAVVLRFLWAALPAGLRWGVGVYVAVSATMGAMAANRAAARIAPDMLSAAVGAALFLTSDALLAIDRFRRPLRYRDVVVLGIYYAGQLLIALSVGLRG